MSQKQRPIRGADLFCGSGGFSTGLVRACEQLFPGRPLDLVAVNHWQVAIDTHQLNHPGVRHFCADLEHLKPRDAVPGGVLDILLAAPACTYHSRARGGKPVHDQQRMDPWHVVRWCTELRVHRLIVENVPEFVDWGPCDVRTGKPIKARKGEYFRAWAQALKAIGMRGEWRVLGCANFGDATTRERFFYYGRSDRKALRWPEPTHTRGGETDLLGTRQPWRAAAEIIDWSRPGTSIFTRKRPLVKNTVSRLLAGAKRNHWPQQHIEALHALANGETPQVKVTAEEAEDIARRLGIPLVMSTGGGGVARGVNQPIPTVTGGGLNGVTPHFAEPIIVNRHTCDYGIGASGIRNPVPTVTTHGAGWLAEPIIIPKCSSTGGNAVRDPMHTIMAGGAGALVQPIIAPYYGGGSGLTAKGADEPLPAQGTKDRFSVATPTLIRAGHGDDGHSLDGRVLDPADPIPSITGSNEIGVATPFLVPNFGERPGQEPRTHAIDEPAPAITATGHIQLAEAFLFRSNQSDGRYGSQRSVSEPMPTVTGSESMAVAKAFIAPCTHQDESNRTRDIGEPLPTITGANRGELALSLPFIANYHGQKSENDHRVCAVNDPLPTQDTENRYALATPAVANGYYIDILYRMLHWSELARATSFEDQGKTYQFTGTATEITKQIGNAVPIRTGSALCAAILEGA